MTLQKHHCWGRRGVCRLLGPLGAEEVVSDRHKTRGMSKGQRAGEGWTQVPSTHRSQETVSDVDSQQPLTKVLFSGSTHRALVGFGYCACYSHCCLYLGVKVDDRPEREEQACQPAVSVALLTYPHLRCLLT